MAKKNCFKDFISFLKWQAEIICERVADDAYGDVAYVTDGHFLARVPYWMYEEFFLDGKVFLPLDADSATVYIRKGKEHRWAEPRRIARAVKSMQAVLDAATVLVDTKLERYTSSGNLSILKCNSKQCYIAVNSAVYHSIIDNFEDFHAYGSGSRSIINITNFDGEYINVEFFLLPVITDVKSSVEQAGQFYEEVEF